MKIYIISEHDSFGEKDIAYATSKARVNEYLSFTTEKEAVNPFTYEWWYEKSSPEVFQKHLENVKYRGKNNLYWYSFRVVESL